MGALCAGRRAGTHPVLPAVGSTPHANRPFSPAPGRSGFGAVLRSALPLLASPALRVPPWSASKYSPGGGRGLSLPLAPAGGGGAAPPPPRDRSPHVATRGGASPPPVPQCVLGQWLSWCPSPPEQEGKLGRHSFNLLVMFFIRFLWRVSVCLLGGRPTLSVGHPLQMAPGLYEFLLGSRTRDTEGGRWKTRWAELSHEPCPSSRYCFLTTLAPLPPRTERATSVLLADPCFQLRSVCHLLGQPEPPAPGTALPAPDRKRFSLQSCEWNRGGSGIWG